jgi:hypothetical protein
MASTIARNRLEPAFGILLSRIGYSTVASCDRAAAGGARRLSASGWVEIWIVMSRGSSLRVESRSSRNGDDFPASMQAPGSLARFIACVWQQHKRVHSWPRGAAYRNARWRTDAISPPSAPLPSARPASALGQLSTPAHRCAGPGQRSPRLRRPPGHRGQRITRSSASVHRVCKCLARWPWHAQYSLARVHAVWHAISLGCHT